MPLDVLQSRYTRGIIIRIDEQKHDQDTVQQLREILRGYPGDYDLQLLLCLADGARVRLATPNHPLDLDPEMRRRVDELLGPGNFRLVTDAKQRNGSRASRRASRPQGALST